MSRPTRGFDPDRTFPSSERTTSVSIAGGAEWERRHAETRGSVDRSSVVIDGRGDGESPPTRAVDRQSRHGRCPTE